MSVETLRSEVHTNFALHHVIKSADQAHFKDQRVYTQPQTEYNAQGSSTEKVEKKGAEKQEQQQQQEETHSLPSRLMDTIQDAKNFVVNALGGHSDGDSASPSDVESLKKDVDQLKSENQSLRKEITEIRQILQKLNLSGGAAQQTAAKPAAKAEPADDEEIDLFGSDDDEEESAELKRVREERLTAYAAKKAVKPGPIAKSSVILDVKPWEDTTDMDELEKLTRSIEMDGLLWGASKLVAVGYGIRKLQIICVVEDAKVSVDDLIEKIEGFEDHVQSVDVVAFNKI